MPQYELNVTIYADQFQFLLWTCNDLRFRCNGGNEWCFNVKKEIKFSRISFIPDYIDNVNILIPDADEL